LIKLEKEVHQSEAKNGKIEEKRKLCQPSKAQLALQKHYWLF